MLSVFAWAQPTFANIYLGIAQRAFDLAVAGAKRKTSLGLTRSMAYHPELQHEIATESGFAFFDTFHAMGGEGTMARWYDNKPRLVNSDYTHQLPGGAAVVGKLLDRALVEGFERWKGHRQ